MIKINTEGDTTFNISGIVSPISLEFGVDKNISGEEKIEVPYTYAEDFDNTNITNEGDSTKMNESFKDQVNKNFNNTLYRIFESKGVYNVNHEGEDNLLKNESFGNKITSIKITGFASPEASTSKSVIPGNKENENENLAKKRTEIAKSAIEEIIKENKIDPSVLDSISYEEVQFSDNEMENLTTLAENLGIKGLAIEDQIIQLVSNYNDGEYNDDESIKKTMDEIVGSKRGVIIDIEFEGKEKKQIVVPIPLLLLLLLSKRIRKGINPANWRRKKKGEEDEFLSPEEEKNLDEVDIEVIPMIKEGGNKEMKAISQGERATKMKAISQFSTNSNENKEKGGQKELNEISQEKYDGMYDDLKMINRKIQTSNGIITTSRGDFKSEYGKKRYIDLKSIPEGIPVRFNKTELQTIGDELEGLLSNSKIISKEDIAKKLEMENKIKSMEDDTRHDLEMLNKNIRESKGIITLSESDFKSDFGKEQYKKLKSIPDGKNVRFNKDELQTIGDQMEKNLINYQKRLKNKVENKKSNFINLDGQVILKNEVGVLDLDRKHISTEESPIAKKSIEVKKTKEMIPSSDIKKIIEEKIGNLAKIEKLNLDFVGKTLKVDGSLNAGILGGQIKIKGFIENKDNMLEIRGEDLDIKARFLVKSRIKKNLSKLAPEMKKYFENKYNRNIKSIQIEGGKITLTFND